MNVFQRGQLFSENSLKGLSVAIDHLLICIAPHGLFRLCCSVEELLLKTENKRYKITNSYYGHFQFHDENLVEHRIVLLGPD